MTLQGKQVRDEDLGGGEDGGSSCREQKQKERMCCNLGSSMSSGPQQEWEVYGRVVLSSCNVSYNIFANLSFFQGLMWKPKQLKHQK